jgi:hypothetical protein
MDWHHSTTTDGHELVAALIFGYREFTNKQSQYKRPAVKERNLNEF